LLKANSEAAGCYCSEISNYTKIFTKPLPESFYGPITLSNSIQEAVWD